LTKLRSAEKGAKPPEPIVEKPIELPAIAVPIPVEKSNQSATLASQTAKAPRANTAFQVKDEMALTDPEGLPAAEDAR